MNGLILLDTDVLIDAGRSVADAVNFLKQTRKHSTLAVSAVTQMELLVGRRNKTELQALDKFLKRFQIIKVDAAISDKAVDLLRTYRLSHGLLIADSFIAATALTINVPFVSKNQRDYNFITGLNLLPYP